jgi:hypothetical protein
MERRRHRAGDVDLDLELRSLAVAEDDRRILLAGALRQHAQPHAVVDHRLVPLAAPANGDAHRSRR